MKIRNYTPHKLDYIVEDQSGELECNGTRYTIKKTFKSEGVSRVNVINDNIGNANGIPVVQPMFGKINGLPGQNKGTIIIASRIVAEAAKANGRDDVYSVGQTIRDGSFILGCINFVKP